MHNFVESVGVDVEQCKISQNIELLWQLPGDVAVVEIDAGDNAEVGIFERRGA